MAFTANTRFDFCFKDTHAALEASLATIPVGTYCWVAEDKSLSLVEPDGTLSRLKDVLMLSSTLTPDAALPNRLYVYGNQLMYTSDNTTWTKIGVDLGSGTAGDIVTADATGSITRSGVLVVTTMTSGSEGWSNTELPTTLAVGNFVSAKIADAMSGATYKGLLNPASPNWGTVDIKEGDYWWVSTEGDLFPASGEDPAIHVYPQDLVIANKAITAVSGVVTVTRADVDVVSGATNIINNLDATTPGSALDATQGKILDDKKIEVLAAGDASIVQVDATGKILTRSEFLPTATPTTWPETPSSTKLATETQVDLAKTAVSADVTTLALRVTNLENAGYWKS